MKFEMLRPRIIPTLLLKNDSLVKTSRFDKFTYVGDPANTLKIFNEFEVDELIILDIEASRSGVEPNYGLLAEIAGECFMPLCYGGGIRSIDQASRIFEIGYEKIAINTAALENPVFIQNLSKRFGAQAIVISLDVIKSRLGNYSIYNKNLKSKTTVEDFAKEAEFFGGGEILLTAVDREGTWLGYDLKLLKNISKAVTIPVIAHGGAGNLSDLVDAINIGGASAVALGALVTFQKKGFGVLINYPEADDLEKYFYSNFMNVI
jgi:cyclase